MNENKVCSVCGSSNKVELHHIIFRSQVKALQHCKLNFTYLCECHHRGTRGVHGKDGHALDQKLKLHFQNKLEFMFTKELLSKEDIRDSLGIKQSAVDSLCKLMKPVKGMFYQREDLIRTCLGGKLITEDEINGRD